MDDSDPSCTTCGSSIGMPCPTCNSAAYCSPKCQSADAPLHALLCASLSSQAAAPPDHVRGLLVPTTGTPSVTWVAIAKTTDPESGISFSSASTSPFFQGVPDPLYTERNPARQRDTLHMLEVWHDDDAGQDVNQAIVDTAGHTHTTWRGPILVLAMTRSTGFMVDPGSYTDLTLHDARDAIDFLSDHGNLDRRKMLKEDLARLANDGVVEIDDDDGGETERPVAVGPDPDAAEGTAKNEAVGNIAELG